MRLRFTIRDLLWLTFLVAMAVGWWVQSRRPQRYLITEKKASVVSFAVMLDTQTGEMWSRTEIPGNDWKPMHP